MAIYMKPSSILIASALLLTWTSASFCGEVFKWTDENGVVQYSDKAPQDKNIHSTKLSIRNSSSHGNSSSMGYDALKQKLNKLETAQKQSVEEENANQKKNNDMAEKSRNCEGAKKMLSTFQENGRIRVKDKNGEYRMLTEEEKAAEETKIKEKIKEFCSPSN